MLRASIVLDIKLPKTRTKSRFEHLVYFRKEGDQVLIGDNIAEKLVHLA